MMFNRLRELGHFTITTLLPALVALALSGCAYHGVLTSYPASIAPLKTGLDSSAPAVLPDTFKQGLQSADQLLYAEEAGRVAQIQGDFDGSINYFKQAIARYEKLDERALVSLSNVGANSSSYFVNDKVIPYEGNSSERIMLHQYQALNYLMLNQLSAAQVELRKTNELQTLQQQALEDDDKKAQKLASGEVSAQVEQLKALGDTPLNPAGYYLTGLLHELFNEPNDAYIDYRKAAELAPNNPALQHNLLRLAKLLSMPQLEEFSARWGEPNLPKQGQGRIVIISERGFVASKMAVDLTLPIDGKLMSIALPSYQGLPSLTPLPQVNLGDNSMPFAELSNISSIAAAELSAELPSIYWRQAARLATKTSMVNQTERDTPASLLGNVLLQAYNVLTEQADLRSWLTLPAQVDLLDNFIQQGQYQLHYGAQQQTVSVVAGQTTLVWIIDTGNMVRFYTKSL
ncbi:hypothetical protein JYB87_15230 [Shewanella avicenniae]|uniref:Tetratricopeptide repeat-containing protein n=1 Tax=Shewanella avicenniae TaxID=2814294 RepID=A0ABX7QPW6_9GAMM|nr:hypothetical protein [Shewanella avicenniae]QSX33067.1 hypothetical protein JYB87_15230 [Shewanella avicenniae]